MRTKSKKVFSHLIVLLFFMITGAYCFAQTPYKGLEPGRSTRDDVNRIFGSPIRDISETLSEYKASDGREKVYVQYGKTSSKIERIEVLLAEPTGRLEIVRSLNLPSATTSSKTNSRGKLEEYFNEPKYVVLTHLTSDEGSAINRIGYYSRELFEKASVKVRNGGLGPDKDGWGFNQQTATILRYFGSTSAPACRAECEKDPKCMAFSWIRPDGYQPNDPPMCYLMSAWTKLVQHPCCISAVKN